MNMRTFTAVLIMLAAFAYAIVRYHLFKGVPWSDFPLYISNKAISLSALLLIALSYLLGSLAHFAPSFFERTLSSRKFFGLAGFGLAAIHGLISLLIFGPKYYPKYYLADGALSFGGELALLFGVISFALFSMIAVSSFPSVASGLGSEGWHRLQRIGYWGLVATMGHVATLGYAGWFDSAGWPGGLYPISLIAFTAALATLLLHCISIVFRPRVRLSRRR